MPPSRDLAPDPAATPWPMLLGAVALPCLAAIAVYLNTFDAPLLYDDLLYIADNVQIRSFEHLPSLWTSPYPAHLPELGLYRPLTATTYLLDYVLAGKLVPAGFHVTNVLLHAVATGLFGLCLARLRWPLAAVFVAGMLFAVHPVHTEAVASIVGRAEVLAAGFCFVGLAAWVRYRRTGRAAWLGCVAVGYFLGLCSKESSVFLPAILFVGDSLGLFAPRERGVGLGAVARRYAPLAGVLVAYLVMRFAALGGFTPLDATLAFAGDPESTRLATAIAGVARYAELSVFPTGMRAIYDAKVTSFGRVDVALGAVILLGVGYVAWRPRRWPWVTFAVLWFAMSLVLVSNLVIEIGAIFAERFLYIPSAAVCAAAGIAIARGLAAGRPIGLRVTCIVLAAVLVALGSYGTVVRNRDWGDAERFWRLAVRQSPTSEGAHEGLAEALSTNTTDEARRDEAIDVLRRGLALREDASREMLSAAHLRMHVDIADLLRRADRAKEALVYDEALAAYLEQFPAFPQYLHRSSAESLGRTLMQLKRFKRAARHFEAAEQRMPDVALFGLLAGEALERQGQFRRAIQKYRASIAARPRDVAAHVRLALCLVQVQRPVDALATLADAMAIQRHPTVVAALHRCVGALEQSGADVPEELLRRAAAAFRRQYAGSNNARIQRLAAWFDARTRPR